MKFQFSEKKVKLPANVHAYAEKKVMTRTRATINLRVVFICFPFCPKGNEYI